ncbi:MAG: hypothetical protein U5N10_12675 [Gemmobacter sp.]|nr:hypothetical protein [Gemmobacter sp.]
MGSGQFAGGRYAGSGRSDDIAMVVVDLADMKVVCAGNFNETSMLTFSNFLVWFMNRYRNTALIIERKSTGTAILGNLMHFLPVQAIVRSSASSTG